MSVLPVPTVDATPLLEPYLIQVVVPFPVGAAEDAVAAAIAAVETLLADVDLVGAPTTTEPEEASDGRWIASTAFVRRVAAEIAAAAIADLVHTPGRLLAMLPTDPAGLAPGTPYNNGNTLSFAGGS